MSRDKLRLYVLARDLGVDSKDLIDLLQSAGRDVKNHMSTIDPETKQLAEDLVSGKVKLPPKAARPAAPETPKPAPPPATAIPSPKARRPGEIPRAARATEEAPEAETATTVAEPPPEPIAVEVAPEPALEPVAPPPVETRPAPTVRPLGPIPSPTTAKPVNLDTGGPGKKVDRSGREGRPSRPRPVIAAPPPSAVARGRIEPAKPAPETPTVKPVMRLPADALRGDNSNLAEIARTGIIPGRGPTSADEDEKKQKGGPTGREERQRRRGQRALERRAAELTEAEEEALGRRGIRSRARRPIIPPLSARGPIVLEPPFTVRSISEAAGIRANDIIRRLMALGVMASINTSLSEEQAELLAMELGLEIEIKREKDVDAIVEETLIGDAPEDLAARPPIVTFMGHVDHGKTSLMDRIRKTNVAAGEAGGITQHIGAYQVKTESGAGAITFLDTPGHEAFTAMRARGANLTDIVVLVVAADDGVKPQTEEAISHAKAANVAIVVAMNKIDLPGANTERLMQQLSSHGLVPEAWGGDVPMIPTSATNGQGIDELLESIALVAELRDPPLAANANRSASGMCVEASLSEGRGVQATILVQNGTLRLGDIVLCGQAYGRVRAMYDDHQRPLKEAGPSQPLVVVGLDQVPEAGEKFVVLDDLAQARDLAEQRRTRARAENQNIREHVTLEKFFDTVRAAKVQELAIILKADVRGSLEAIKKEIGDFHHAEVRVKVIHDGVGGISESDVLLADASDAIIIGFRVAPDERAMALASEKGVQIRRYDIIYQVSDDIKNALEGMLKPETREVQLGRAVVQEIFNISRVGTVAGCRVVQGTIERSARLRIIRDGTVIGAYPLETLRRFKDDVREVREGMECGLKLAGFDDVKREDVLEAFKIEEIKRTL